MPRLELLCSNQRLGQITQTQGLIIHDIMQKQNSVIVLLYIFKQSAKEDTSLQVGKSLRTLQMRSLEMRDFELDMISTDIGLLCQLHVLLYIDCMLSTYQSFPSKSSV